MVMDPDKFESRAEAALQQFAETAKLELWSDKDPRWTPGVKAALGRIAKESLFDWFSTNSEFADNSEWLLDGVAWQKDHTGAFSLPFTLESEWEDNLGSANLLDGVSRDFLK